MIHLIASDIDGTLLQGGQTRLDPALFDVIERLEQHGIRFAAAKTAVWSSATAVCCISR